MILLKTPSVYKIRGNEYEASAGVSAMINRGVSVTMISHRLHNRIELAPGQHCAKERSWNIDNPFKSIAPFP
jgi:hypothetical protein